ncbi:MAG: preprotein translocase subunit SecG [Pseudomonadota bacterium]|nr:preprotein translocase subunit SecG [Pseudomonadota bacterium]
MTTIILVIHLLIAIALVVVVLLQRSEGGGLGIGGGGSGSGLVSVRGTANLLTRATAVLAACFMLTSLTLAILARHAGEPTSVLDANKPAPTNTAPGQPSVPLSK